MSAAHKSGLHPGEDVRLGDLAGKVFKFGGAAGAALLAITVVLGFIEDDSMKRFFFSYLVGLTFFLSIALGALFFVILQPLVRAEWSVAVRRIAEILTGAFPALGALFAAGILVPMLLGNEQLYLWTDHTRAHEHILHQKAVYLNVPFFALRAVIYFVAWTLISRWFFRKSVEQDETGDPAMSEKLRIASAPAIIAFAFTTAFAAMDLLMSLDPYWFSTIFGVYFFAGCAISIFAVLSLVSMALQRRGKLVHSITVEHYHDLGKLLFAFVFFWGYIAFSQFMLIWYADIPEETRWFQHRMFNWTGLSMVLLFGHFCVPFLFLLSRWTKRWLGVLAGFSGWMLLMHYFDLFWLALPEYSPDGFTFGIIDVTALLGIGGIFAAAVAREAGAVRLIPIRDPKLDASLHFENY